MATLPGALALASIADGALAIAADLRNNYAAVQTYANDLRTLLAGGTTGQVLTSGGTTTVSWAAPVSSTIYSKTTSKTVNTTVAATDLLNAEITIAAGVMGTGGMARLTCWGDWLQNSGGAAAAPRLQLVLGGTTLLDTGTTAAGVSASATRGAWRLVAEIMNTGAANAQLSSLNFTATAGATGGATGTAFTTGTGYYQSLSNGAATDMLIAQGTNNTALDTATSKTLVLNVINGSASASYETKLFGAKIEIVV